MQGGFLAAKRSAASAPPPAIPQYTDGATMDAAVAVGDVVELIGSTTGERIQLLECGQISPSVKYYPRSPLQLFNSTEGDEFTGVINFEALGTGTLPSWASSTPGSATVGGPIPSATGTCKINGYMPLSGKRGIMLRIVGYLVARLAAVTNNIFGVGVVSDGDDTVISCAFFGKSASSWANGSVGDGAVNGPTVAFNTNWSAQPDLNEVWEHVFFGYPYNGNPAAGMQCLGGAVNDGQSGISASTNDATNTHVADTDLQPAFVRVGAGMVYHMNKIIFYCD